MPSNNYLTRRGRVWYFRRRIPTHLQATLGRREIVISLKTKNRTQARPLADAYQARYDAVFAEANRTNIKMAEFPWDKIANNPNLRTSRFKERTTQKPDGSVEHHVEVDPEAIRALAEAGLPPEKIAELVEKLVSKKQVVSVPQPSAPTRAVPTAAPQSVAGASVAIHDEKTVTESPQADITLEEVIAQFNQDRIDEKGQPGWNLPNGDLIKLRRLVELLGADKSLNAVTRADAKQVRTTLSHLPADATRTKGLTVQAAIQAAQPQGNYVRLSPDHINDHLAMYRRLFKWAIAEELFSARSNPFEGVKVGKLPVF